MVVGALRAVILYRELASSSIKSCARTRVATREKERDRETEIYTDISPAALRDLSVRIYKSAAQITIYRAQEIPTYSGVALPHDFDCARATYRYVPNLRVLSLSPLFFFFFSPPRPRRYLSICVSCYIHICASPLNVSFFLYDFRKLQLMYDEFHGNKVS